MNEEEPRTQYYRVYQFDILRTVNLKLREKKQGEH